ncbi:MAG: T9SS type A sorting domain-containing protein, partial [Arcicella sp.]|nr:T9SS type A sorting domain-containing protein [Arcicella sp.]
ILKEGIKNYYAPIPQSLVGDIGRFTLSSQNKYLISNSLFTDIDISNVELVVGKSPNGGKQITEQQIIIFPNPTMDKITVDLSEIEDNIESIVLKDHEGNTMKDLPLPVDKQFIQLDMKSYRMGIYFIQVQTNTTIITKKIILNQD